MDAEAMPLPNDLTTPPVTNMYFLAMTCGLRVRLQQFFHPFQVLGGIHADRVVTGLDDPDADPPFQRPQLLQPLMPLGFRNRPARKIQ